MSKSIHSVVLTALLGVVMLLGFTFTASAVAELPEFDVDNFSNSTVIDNPWFSLQIGREMEFEGKTEDGLEHIEIEITGDTKTVMGIKTLVYRDRVWVDGELVEDTRDYIAQDDDGNVWYLGEDVDNYEDGELDNHDGAWLTGVDGAEPGYWMPANPQVGDEYKQEFYEGEAEDEAEVVSLQAEVTTEAYGTFSNCLKTKDTTSLEPDVVEYKYYCKQVNGLVVEEKPEDDERIELLEWEIEDGDDEDADEEEDELEYNGNDDEQDDFGKNGNVRQLQMRLVALLQQLIALLKSQM